MRDAAYFLLVILLGLFLRCCVLSFVWVRGSSMRNTLRSGDLLLALRSPLLFRQVRRGQIVICHYPGRYVLKNRWIRREFVKRVVGLPGETVEMVGGTVLIDGRPLKEPYLSPERNRLRRTCPPVTLGAGEYFLLGDHRDNSNDSRSVGPIRRKDIVGLVVCHLLPWQKNRA